MKQYAEYFIGGPMDGREKTKEFPSTPEWGVVRSIQFTGDVLTIFNSTEEYPMDIEWDYRQGKFVFGGIVIKFWTDARLISREVIACRLAELIMEPHEKQEPEKCVCTDSVHSATGFCPTKESGEYDMCPRRRLPESIIREETRATKVNLTKGTPQ